VGKLPASAAIIIIGNEILSGKVKDENFHFLARELRALGVALRFAATIPDDVEEIAKVIRDSSQKYDYVFTSGGVGPTHDDVTMRGIARAFDVKMVPNEEMRRSIIKHCGGKEPSGIVLRMAELPEGSELIRADGMNFPPVLVRNVYIFPGIPEFLRKKFEAIKERFRGKSYHLKLFYLNEDECYIADALEAVADEFRDVEIGSYPKVGEKDFKVMVTLESRDEAALAGAAEKLLLLLPRGILVRTG
jgi:FAD synthetase